MEPGSQQQHRLPQVYLKPFGYNENGKWKISVLEFGHPRIYQKDVKTFLAQENIFDFLVMENIDDRRYFEKMCQRIETKYPSITKSIKRQIFTDEHWHNLCDFMTSLMTRTKAQRSFYRSLISHPSTKRKFIQELSCFNERADSDLTLLTAEYNLDQIESIVSWYAGAHVVKCLSAFTYTILKAPNQKFWPTSDDPVTVDRQGEEGLIIPLEAEIYFPVTRQYCLFIYHPNSSINNHPLRKLKPREFHDCDEVSHAYIVMKIARHAYQYLIFSEKIEISFEQNLLRDAFSRIAI